MAQFEKSSLTLLQKRHTTVVPTLHRDKYLETRTMAALRTSISIANKSLLKQGLKVNIWKNFQTEIFLLFCCLLSSCHYEFSKIEWIDFNMSRSSKFDFSFWLFFLGFKQLSSLTMSPEKSSKDVEFSRFLCETSA